jgi:hypothetical protein
MRIKQRRRPGKTGGLRHERRCRQQDIKERASRAIRDLVPSGIIKTCDGLYPYRGSGAGSKTGWAADSAILSSPG